MFKTVEWNEGLDLSWFYKEAGRRGYQNNKSKKAMIDCFRHETSWNAWILYQNDIPIGSVAAHSFFDIMGNNSYRILTRTCSFAEYSPHKGLITPKKLIAQHQNFTDQFFVARCISWAGKNAKLYATSNNSEEASQRLVHKYYFPTLEKKGIVSRNKEIFYRGIQQTVWKIDANLFLDDLEKFPKW